MTDCIVVGGGLVGMFTARELRAAGMSVLLLERGHTGRESSWAGGGILSPLYPWRYPAPISVMARWSQLHYAAILDELRTATGFDPEWVQCGMLVLDVPDHPAVTGWAEQFGVALEILDEAQVRQCEPGLQIGQNQSIWLPEVAQVRTPRLGKALRESLHIAGVDIREHCDVHKIRIDDGQVAGVETASGFIPARSVVVAGGAWSAGLLATVGIVIPVRPIRGQMILIRGRPGMLRRILLKDGRYLIPRQDGRVLVGSTEEDVGFNKEVTGTARGELHKIALELVPGLGTGDIEQQWAGLRPGSPDHLPRIGACPQIQGLWVNTGHFRNGVLLAPASARILVDMVLGRQSFMESAPFALAGKVDTPLNVV